MTRPLLCPLKLIRIFLLLALTSCIYQYTFSQATKFGNSYINLSKKTIGGTVQNGDTLEIRTCYYFSSGYNSNAIYFVRYVDNVPTKTIFASDSLRLITNEGLTYKRWTPASDTDPGTYDPISAAGRYNVRINIGRSATNPTSNSKNTVGSATVFTGGGSQDKPRVGGGNTLITTSFKVKVTGNIGDTVILGAGQLLYKLTNSSTASDVVMKAIQYQILITSNDPICPNAIGKNFVGEGGGSFDSGKVQNRSTGPSYPIPNYTYFNNISNSQSVGDGAYAILNNLSPWASTNQNAEKRNNCVTSTAGSPPPAASCANRMFTGHWDIMGDHTGSTNATGNAPVAKGTRGGYMLIVNADYATSEAYRQDISGLCPNTTYEFSLWVKNICTNCGVDSSGNQTWKPGVLPNLSFAIDDLDRYTSGPVDTLGWQKKGFLFKTGASQSSITISIRNNASGGGGNDWAIDDIALVTCNPNLNLTPSGNQNVCTNSQVDISSTVTSFFNNYTFFRFERSVDNGVTWTVPGSGTGNPVTVSNGYEYTAQLPPFIADSAHNMNQYRFIVASSVANLSTAACAYTASTKIFVTTSNCVALNLSDSSSRISRTANRYNETKIEKVINPFSDKLSFNIITAKKGPVRITVADSYGSIVRRVSSNVSMGYNPFILREWEHVSKGTYFLRVDLGNESFNRILIKIN